MTHKDGNKELQMVKINMECLSTDNIERMGEYRKTPSTESDSKVTITVTEDETDVSSETSQFFTKKRKKLARLKTAVMEGDDRNSRHKVVRAKRITRHHRTRSESPENQKAGKSKFSTQKRKKLPVAKTGMSTPIDSVRAGSYASKELAKFTEDSLLPSSNVDTVQSFSRESRRRSSSRPSLDSVYETSGCSSPRLSVHRLSNPVGDPQGESEAKEEVLSSNTTNPQRRQSVFDRLFYSKSGQDTTACELEPDGTALHRAPRRKSLMKHRTSDVGEIKRKPYSSCESQVESIHRKSQGTGAVTSLVTRPALVTRGSRLAGFKRRITVLINSKKTVGRTNRLTAEGKHRPSAKMKPSGTSKSQKVAPSATNSKANLGNSNDTQSNKEQLRLGESSLWTKMGRPTEINRKDSTEENYTYMQRFTSQSPRILDIKQAKPGITNVNSEGKADIVVVSSAYVVSPEGDGMYMWLAFMSVAVIYNLWTIIAREAFSDIRKGYDTFWFCADGMADFIYVCDIVVQMRTGYLEKGILVCETKKLAKHYMSSRMFIYDMFALTPLDLLQFYNGIHPILRFPRFLKIYRSFHFLNIVGMKAIYPNVWRVANLTHALFLGAHWFASFYFLLSRAENFEGSWNYPKPVGDYACVTRQYLKSLYWSTMTLTNIGDIRHPETNIEYCLCIGSYLIGVFIFAAIVGQVGNVIANKNAARADFERLLDGAKAYMHNHRVPSHMQYRVVRWYNYAWSRGRIGGVGGDFESLALLPEKLKTELALFVNMDTLKKVTIFQECEPEFLHDVVLKMKAFIFTPGDMVCRKGEVAREMFIISDGMLEITNDTGIVVATLTSGDFFGEIGILNIDSGINRRSADVKSVGYSELLVLLRSDVLTALKDYPTAEHVLTTCALNRLKELKTQVEKSSSRKPALTSATLLNIHNSMASLCELTHDYGSNVFTPRSSNLSLDNVSQYLLAQKSADRRRVSSTKSLTEPSQSSLIGQNDDVILLSPKPSYKHGLEAETSETGKLNAAAQTKDKTEGNSSNNNIYTTLRCSVPTKMDDSLMYWQPPFVRYKSLEAGDNVTGENDAAVVEDAKGDDMNDLLDDVQILFSCKMERIHKYYRTKIKELEADNMEKQLRIEELCNRETP